MKVARKIPDWRLCAVWMAALLPFGFSWFVQVRGAKAQSICDSVPRAGMSFEQYMVNLGSPPPRSEYAGRFSFQNVSTQPLKILELTPSCGCLNPRLEKREFAAGEVGEFYLRVRAANERPGPHEYTCKITYDDGQPRETEVRFKISLPEERVEIRPRALAIYQFNDQPTTREISITDFRSTPEDRPLSRLEIVEAVCSFSWAEISIGEAQIDETGQRRQTLQITVTKVPPGTHHGSVIVKTNVPEYAELRVPLRIEGPMPSEGRAANRSDSPTHPPR